MGLILIPAVVVERWSRLHINGLPDIVGLFIRVSLYSLVVLGLVIVTKSHLWFLAKRPGEPRN
jgi:hypothetical protein